MRHLGDITKISGYDVPIVDCVIGGSPCQDLSVAGLRKGLKHEANGDDETTRSGLFIEQIRIIKEMREHDKFEQLRGGRTDVNVRPRFAIWENVPGAFSSNKGDDFRVVLEEMARIADEGVYIPRPEKKWSNAGCVIGDSWSIAWRVFDAQHWGVPQRRKRICLVADFNGHSAPEIVYNAEHIGCTDRTDTKSSVGNPGTASRSKVHPVSQGLPGYPSQSSEKGQGTSRDSSESIGGTGERENECVIYAIDQQGGKGMANYALDVMPTLCSDSHGTPHSVAIPYTLQIRSGCEGDGIKPLTSIATDSDHVPVVFDARGSRIYSIGHDIRSARLTEDGITDPMTATDFKEPIMVVYEDNT